MKTVVAMLQRPTRGGRKPRAAGADAHWLAITPVRKPGAANRHIRFDFLTSIWCGAMAGCIGAPVIAPFPEADHEGLQAEGRTRLE